MALTFHTLTVGQMAANCYVVTDSDSDTCVIVDPGDDAEFITDKISGFGCTPTAIIATHGHFDHNMSARALQLAYRIPYYIHNADTFLVERLRDSARHFLGYRNPDPPPEISAHMEDGARIPVGGGIITALHTPGHTPGSMCLYAENDHVLLTGDTLFADGAVGRTDWSYGDRGLLTSSLARILSLPPDTRLLPGHGQETTVRRERTYHTA